MGDFFAARDVRAAKPHRCEQSGCRIAVGARHVYCAGRIEGDFMAYRLCLDCDLVGRWAVTTFSEYCEGYPLGDLFAELRNDLLIDDPLAAAQAWAAEIAAKAERRAAEREAG